MRSPELKQAIEALLKRAPKPETIASANTAMAFKKAAKEAQQAKSLDKMQTALTQLKGFYQ